MGVPKLKLYRLPKNSASNSLVDVQHIQGDELLPFIPKQIQPAQHVRTLVGIQSNPDNFLRIGYRGIENYIDVNESTQVRGSQVYTQSFLVNGWILGENNIKLYVYPESNSGSGQFTTDFRYELTTKNQGYNSNGEISTSTLNISAYYQDTYMTIYLGERFFLNGTGYKSKSSDVKRRYRVYYRNFQEMIDTPEVTALNSSFTTPSNSLWGLNRGDIYNGTVTGVYKDRLGRMSDNSDSNSQFGVAYEGNYFYQIRYYPLRVKSIDNSLNNSVIQISNSLLFPLIDENEALPIIAEKRKNSDNIYYYQSLVKGVQYNIEVLKEPDKIKITFTEYYNQKYPKEVYLFYNYMGDRIDTTFELDYHYSNSDVTYAQNKGVVFESNGNGIVHKINNKYYLKKRNTILAVQEGYGYDSNSDLKMIVSSGNIIQIDLSSLSSLINLKVYNQRDLINSNSYSLTNNQLSMTFASQSQIPKDLMIAYDDLLQISAEGEIQGIRAVGNVKKRTTDTFVSSHPFWVLNHMFQNPDVFVGYSTYSGVNTEAYATDGIYPNYQENIGVYSLNTEEGMVKFNNQITQINLKYVRNFVSQINTKVTSTIAFNDSLLYLNPVKANYAHYDGIYKVRDGKFSCYTKQGGCHYALMEDEFFKHCKDKKFLAIDDSIGFNKTFYKGKNNLLKTELINNDDGQNLNITSSLQTIKLDTDRIKVVEINKNTTISLMIQDISISVYNNNGIELTFSGNNGITLNFDGIGAYQNQQNEICIPAMKKSYDEYSLEYIQTHMPRAIYSALLYDICVELIGFGGNDEKVAYLAIYRLMR